jgi:hypothetical protein
MPATAEHVGLAIQNSGKGVEFVIITEFMKGALEVVQFHADTIYRPAEPTAHLRSGYGEADH